MAEDLSQKKLFVEQPTQNNYPVIASIVASQIPLANVFNGQSALVDVVNQMTANGTQTTNIQFSQIQQRFDFKMYKLIRPKVIFSTYLARQLPDASLSSSNNSVFQPTVQFKIDYDPCCVGSMMLMLTLDLSVRDTIQSLNVYGYSIGNNRKYVTIQKEDIKSIQFSYGTDFIYHYIKSISLGWANTGGNSPVIHQEVPIEIAKIYHSLLVEPGMSETIKRSVREDMFVIGHDPHRQFGNFSFALKNPASIVGQTTTSNNGNFNFNIASKYPSGPSGDYKQANAEIAMYWSDARITDIGYGSITNNSGYSDKRNIQATFADPRSTGSKLTLEYAENSGDKVKYIKSLNIDTSMYWYFGDDTTTFKLTIGETANDENQQEYVFPANQAPIHLVSDGKAYVEALTADKLSMYPSVELNSNVETAYIVPVLEYTATTADFKVYLYVKNHSGAKYNVAADAEGQAVAHDLTVNTGIVSSLNPGRVVLSVVASTKGINGNYDTTTTSTIFSLTDSTNRWTDFTGAGTVDYVYTGFEYKLNFNSSSPEQFSLTGAAIQSSFGNKYLVGDTVASVSASSLANYIISQTQVNGNKVTLVDFMTETVSQMGSYLLQTFGAMSPLMQQANIAYINLDIQPYDENDLAIYSVSIYQSINGTSFLPTGDNMLEVYRYNSAILANGQSEENYPAIKNVDGLSIHTYRKVHGIVDFYFPMQFLFICQGICNSFSHYACAAQSIIVKFQFNNPLAFVNTSISINPLALDPTDYSKKERILINRVKPEDVIYSNFNNLRFILFYLKYVWVPQLNPVLAGYRYYNWVTDNYEKITKQIPASSASEIELGTFNKANFYTEIWIFFVNNATLYVDQNGGSNLEYVPVNVNKYHLELWDTTKFSIPSSYTNLGASVSDLTNDTTLAQYNSVYYQTPIESVQMVTKSSINMTDNVPYRVQMFTPYLLYEHTGINSSLKFNNLLQMKIDSVFYENGFSYCMYSPAYAPDFTIKAYLRSGQTQEFGAIIIPTYKNVSYISKHVMLLKY